MRLRLRLRMRQRQLLRGEHGWRAAGAVREQRRRGRNKAGRRGRQPRRGRVPPGLGRRGRAGECASGRGRGGRRGRRGRERRQRVHLRATDRQALTAEPSASTACARAGSAAARRRCCAACARGEPLQAARTGWRRGARLGGRGLDRRWRGGGHRHAGHEARAHLLLAPPVLEPDLRRRGAPSARGRGHEAVAWWLQCRQGRGGRKGGGGQARRCSTPTQRPEAPARRRGAQGARLDLVLGERDPLAQRAPHLRRRELVDCRAESPWSGARHGRARRNMFCAEGRARLASSWEGSHQASGSVRKPPR